MVFINHIEVLSGDAAIVEINGPLNGETSPDFESYVNSLLKKNICFILFDAKNLEFVSSEGIGVILFIQKKLSENNGFFIMYGLSDEVRLLYNILGFDKVIKIADSKIDAMQIMDRHIELREGKDTEPAKNIAGSETANDNNEVVYENDETKNKIEVDDDFFEGINFIEEDNNEVTEESVKEKFKELNDTILFEQFVVECTNCKTLVRIKKSGDYLCPTCKIEFNVDENQAISFK